jgi:oligopeptide/dipeptide ABC transporter ATP-binding protein
MTSADLLQVRNLCTYFFTSSGEIPAADNISFDIKSGEVVGLVGESGCGKSITALSILRLLPASARTVRGSVWFEGADLLRLSEGAMRTIRGQKIAMIFQEPMTALNPVMSIGDQVAEPLRVHGKMTRKQAREEAKALLNLVKIPDVSKRIGDYPHQLSGGMRQRVMIAMAMACRPRLLIADEPTAALDVTIQAQILQLLDSLRREFQLSILFITHALGVIAELADRVIVMYAGRIVERASVHQLFYKAAHPYTIALLNSAPRVHTDSIPNRLKTIEGSVPDLSHLPGGCFFYERCSDRMDVCNAIYPPQTDLEPDHSVACHKFVPTT